MFTAQIIDDTGAAALLVRLSPDRRYDADWFREASRSERGGGCIADLKSRKVAGKYDKRCYKRRNRVEIMFGRFEDRVRPFSRSSADHDLTVVIR
ncbi:hypothetical protein F8R15_18305 [Thioclava sp. JE_KL1]|nr:hypothetical protein [Thioclava sp. JE_KL1]